jgi:hypothetical protein
MASAYPAGCVWCDDVAGVARPGRAVKVSDCALREASPEPQWWPPICAVMGGGPGVVS